MHPNHTGKNILEEYSELVMRSVRDEAQQLLRQWAAEAQQRQQSFMAAGGFPVLGNGAMSGSTTQRTVAEDPTAIVWLGADHRGYIQGPVSLNLLSIWFQLGFLAPDFRVWKISQYQSQSVHLVHLLNN